GQRGAGLAVPGGRAAPAEARADQEPRQDLPAPVPGALRAARGPRPPDPVRDAARRAPRP
ncbi:unnamed protein product, partial [Heterosigma akashiwo]